MEPLPPFLQRYFYGPVAKNLKEGFLGENINMQSIIYRICVSHTAPGRYMQSTSED